MTMHRPSHVQWLVGLGGWTFFVWFQRIGNVLRDDDLSGLAMAWRLVVAVGFVVAALVLVGGVLGSGRLGSGRLGSGGSTARRIGGAEADLAAWVSPVGVVLAVVGSVWWILRGGQILIGDWNLAFKAVHTVLAVVVVGLSVMVWRTRGYDRLSYG